MKVLRISEVCTRLGDISRVTLWRLVRDDPSFPKAIRLGRRIPAWFEHDIDAWLSGRAAQIQSAVGA
ncbi:helix-turn-helix transcriptional regulator [Chitinimonas koreensis]|uniref:helix-turn-helix transcriptional regulator n=1 Tax=Chitinimonas koreensis TaxID=356302 RepID=UPI000A056DB4|nr:AlpA family phage regulatory protein [Chitinimonas koreensis]QNM97116.1 AlpA family phage regulatory protein [Chitinimonas koreensis]